MFRSSTFFRRLTAIVATTVASLALTGSAAQAYTPGSDTSVGAYVATASVGGLLDPLRSSWS